MKRGKILEIIKHTLAKSGIRKAYLFGSFARRAKHYEDIDIAIVPPAGLSLLDLAHIENVLEERTKKKIDLGTLDSIHPLVKEHVKKEMVALL